MWKFLRERIEQKTKLTMKIKTNNLFIFIMLRNEIAKKNEMGM